MGDLFPLDYSTLIFDHEGKLLRFTLADDEQYRAPPLGERLPDKYVQAVLTWEDKRFHRHPGVDPLAMMRALVLNLRSGGRVSGGSTITMQVIRLSRPRSRTYVNKLREVLLALKLTLHSSKQVVLDTYANHVPMGGNVVGMSTASWCYYGKPAQELTWSEACLFAVLPNSPALLNLQIGREELRDKRNRLLARLQKSGLMDSTTLLLAQAESLPAGHFKLPFEAPHFAQQIINAAGGGIVKSSLDLRLQETVEGRLKAHHAYLKSRGIANLAVLVAETQTGKVRTYMGSQDFFDNAAQGQVDGIRSRRSTGSLLKPFLVAKALDRGPFTIDSQIQDVPTYFGTFAPQNASKTYSGSASINELLVSSLNIPAVRLLNTIGVSDFYDMLLDLGFTGLFRGADGYGLALILGGAEASLWEMVQAYVELGRLGEPVELSLFEGEGSVSRRPRSMSRGSCFQVISVLQNLTRPGSDHYWQNFSYQIPVSWKTGTSYGQKDGWAIGLTPEYTVGVWVGNFDGEGNPELGGARSAGPILFDILNNISGSESVEPFEKPEMDLRFIEICAQSGYPAGRYCPEKQVAEIPSKSHVSGTCPFHKRYILDKVTGEDVCSLCWGGSDKVECVLYIQPPAVQKVLQEKGRDLVLPPKHRSNCSSMQHADGLQLLYPLHNITVFVPRNFDGSYEKILLEALHPQPSAHLFWIMDEVIIGETDSLHTLAIDMPQGQHWLTIMDEEGNSKTIGFESFRNESNASRE